MKKLILIMILFCTAASLFCQNYSSPSIKSSSVNKETSIKESGSPNKTSSQEAKTLPDSNIKKEVKEEDDQMTFTFFTTQTMSLMNSSSRTYFSLPSESEEAFITEIIPVNENLFKLTLSIPSGNSKNIFNIYVKKGEILGIKSKGSVFIGSVENFDYNSFSILGKRF